MTGASLCSHRSSLDPGSGPGLRGGRGSGQRTADSGKWSHAYTLVSRVSSAVAAGSVTSPAVALLPRPRLLVAAAGGGGLYVVCGRCGSSVYLWVGDGWWV